MGSVASELKSEREKRKISLSQIAADTRISLRYLESLEEGRYQDLPGGMYNRAFLRAYCESIHLDQKQIMQRYEAELIPPSDRPQKSRQHIPQKDSSFRLSPVLVWSLMLLISAGGIFFSRKWIATVFSPYFSHRPASTVAQELARRDIPATVPAASKAPVVDSQGAGTGSPAAAAPQPSIALGADGQKATMTENQGVGSPDAQSPPSLRLEVEATQSCWISIDRDGNPAIRRLLAPGEIQTLNATEQFLMILGNAGGVRVKINNKPTKSFGKTGEVVKVHINEGNLQDFLDQTSG